MLRINKIDRVTEKLNAKRLLKSKSADALLDVCFSGSGLKTTMLPPAERAGELQTAATDKQLCLFILSGQTLAPTIPYNNEHVLIRT